MFVPQRFPTSTWEKHKAKGYQLKLYMPMQTRNMDAQQFLAAMRDTYTSFGTMEDDSTCVFAKVIGPEGKSACLRMDRDYTEIYRKDETGTITTLACWQPAALFKGLSQQELWCNMVALMNHSV